ncbi:MAG: apolipoprotein N-acyltransferase [Deltaproteobacteria bacterium]|nr:apolipoprotein N-acyltransferase [Deltaproteobacteria bacterium]
MQAALLSLSSSLLLVLAFPAFDFAFLAWIALVPLFLAIAEQPCGRAFALAFLAGVGFFTSLFAWILSLASFTVLDFVAGGFYLGAYIGAFGFIFVWLLRRTRLPACFIAPPVWIVMEYLRAHVGFLSLPWGFLGHTQYRSPLLTQIAALTGVYGVSSLVVTTNAALSDLFLLWRRSQLAGWKPLRKQLLAPMAMLGSVWGVTLLYGWWTLATPLSAETLKVTVVQGNISQELKWKREFHKRNLEAYVELTREAHRRDPAALTIWPESSFPGSLTKDWSLASVIGALLKEINTPLLIGSLERPEKDSEGRGNEVWFNSASLAVPRRGIPGQYQKIHLLPFGEYLPFAELFPWPARLQAASQIRPLLPGKDYTVFDLDGRRFSVLICWENLFPELARTFVAGGAEFLVNMTNEAWFSDPAASRQFLAISVFRAVENRVALVRAANTGVSSFIDPYGRVLARVQDEAGKDLFVAGHLTREVPLMHVRTFYNAYGDLWVGCHVVALAGLCFFVRPESRVR